MQGQRLKFDFNNERVNETREKSNEEYSEYS